MTKDTEEAEALHVFFASIFTGMTDFQECQAPETREIDWSTDDLSSLEKDQVWEHLNKTQQPGLWVLMGSIHEA